MTKDYYKILRIERSARDEDIKKAYHNLALKYHPDKNKAPSAEQRFKEILEAYQVLSDKQRRYKYDIDLELSADHKNNRKAYSPWTNPYDSYDRKNLTLGAFIHFLSKIKHSNVYRFDMYGPSKVISQPTKEPPVEHDIFVTLEELNYGVTRKVKFSRLAYGGLRHEDKVFEVAVRPGCKAGTKILFPREGDRLPGNIPADLIFVVREKPHPIFERIGSDLKYSTTIPLHMALSGNSIINVPTLDGKLVQLTIKDEIIKPSTVKLIPRKGLPNFNDPQKRGNLMVTFKIKYPESMTAKTRKMIARNLFH